MNKVFIISAAIAATCVIFIASKNIKKENSENEAKEEAGFDYFYAQRSYPYNKIDYAAHQTAARSAKNELALMRTTSTAAWQYAGPNNIGGRIVDIEMDPANMNVAYLGAASGGVFKTTDQGTTWFPVFDNETSLSIGDIAIAHSNTNIIYVGTGEANGGSGSLTYDANGVYKSTDAGLTWTNVGLQLTRMTGRMAVHPTNADIVFAATMGDMYGNTPDRGLYRSADGGTSWTKVLFLNDSTGCADVVINPVNPNYVFATTWERTRRPNDKRYYGESSGVWRSTDGGITWSQLTNGLPAVGGLYSRIGVDLCASDPSTVYAMYIDDTYAFGGLFKSTNNGDTWTQTNDSYLTNNNAMATQGYWYGRIKVDPTDADIVYVIGFDMYKTTNGGNSWGPTFEFAHVDQHEIAVHPLDHDFVMNGNDGGLHISTDGGDNWIHHEDLPITQFYTCGMDNSNPDVLLGGTQDNNIVRTFTGSFFDWENIIGGDGFYALIDPTDNTYWYGEYQYGNMFRSDDGGFNFDPIMNGLFGSGNWNCPIVFDPQNPQTLYTGYQQVFRTDDRGDNWFSISPDLTIIDPTGSLLFGTITSIDVSPLNSDIIYAGTDDGKVWNSLNGGGTWTNVTGTLPVRWITRVTCDPFITSRAFVTLSGYRYHDNMAHVYMTTNNGTTWNDISGNLPDVPCSDIIADPAADSLLYLANDAGVYFTRDMGASWNLLGTGMPTLICTDLALHNPTHTLLAATYGRGMYKIDLSAALGTEQGNVSALSGFKIYPNPASEFIVISSELGANKKVELTITNIQGKKVYQTEFEIQNSKFETKIDVSGFSRGIYFVCIMADETRKVEKMVFN
ncbi:MAG TPA: T9SS type A sorting domain-containing protein [Bacteroidia bacterium]|nr:T9SS type A sorting domain-containing protein [Bacteroidia bacterium]